MASFVTDIATAYAVAVAASCAWFSYQWFFTGAMRPQTAYVRGGGTAMVGPPANSTREIQDVLTSAAMAPVKATLTLWQHALSPGSVQVARPMNLHTTRTLYREHNK
jgi:hypothetical protein